MSNQEVHIECELYLPAGQVELDGEIIDRNETWLFAYTDGSLDQLTLRTRKENDFDYKMGSEMEYTGCCSDGPETGAERNI